MSKWTVCEIFQAGKLGVPSIIPPPPPKKKEKRWGKEEGVRKIKLRRIKEKEGRGEILAEKN